MTVDEKTNFFTNTLPAMQKLCLELPNIVTCPVPALKIFMNHSITLSQRQIACLLANAFFSTFPNRFGDPSLYPSINFSE